MDDALVSSALAGTSRRAPDLTTGTPVDDLSGALGDRSRERALLLAAGAASLYERASLIPSIAPDAPAPAAAETRTEAAARVADLVALMLAGTYREFLPEALERMGRVGLILPPTLLPAALAAPTWDLRTLLRPVLGERGRWLARLNPEWCWAVDSLVDASGDLPNAAETIWEEGTEAERLAVLRLLRRHDPAKARAWIEGAWASEKADFRKDALEVCEDNLSMDDEPFLERVLDDRGSTVRAVGAALLSHLPDSRLSTRMAARADAMLSFEKKMLRGLKIEVTLPEGAGKDWIRDGVESKPPHGVGVKQWLLQQVIATVAPHRWEDLSGARPYDVVAAATKTEWENALIEGWRRAALLHKDGAWADVLYRRPKNGGSFGVDVDLLTLSSIEQIERAALDALDWLSSPEKSRWVSLVLQALPVPWRAPFGLEFLTALRKQTYEAAKLKSTQVYYWTAFWSATAKALPPACLNAAAQPWRLPDDFPSPTVEIEWRRQIDAFVASVRFRQEMIKEIPL